jgi:hypothetical protein
MEGLIRLSLYLLLALFLPGLIVFAAAVMLFPELANELSLTAVETLGAVLLTAFVIAHIPFMFEKYVLNAVWDWMFPELKLGERSRRLYMRSSIITRAQWRKIDHTHYDQTLGEFILFTNTSFWFIILSTLRLMIWPGLSVKFFVAATILVGGLVTLLWAALFFKKSYLDILDVLDEVGKREPETSEKKDT